MSVPHGLLGKAYARTFGVALLFIVTSIVATALGIRIIAAPFWIIAIIAVVLVLAALGFVAWLTLTQARGGEG